MQYIVNNMSCLLYAVLLFLAAILSYVDATSFEGMELQPGEIISGSTQAAIIENLGKPIESFSSMEESRNIGRNMVILAEMNFFGVGRRWLVLTLWFFRTRRTIACPYVGYTPMFSVTEARRILVGIVQSPEMYEFVSAGTAGAAVLYGYFGVSYQYGRAGPRSVPMSHAFTKNEDQSCSMYFDTISSGFDYDRHSLLTKALYSQNKKFTMRMERCNLVLHPTDTHLVILWASRTVETKGHCDLKVQFDGNIVIYLDEAVVWYTGFSNKNKYVQSVMDVTNDGHLRLSTAKSVTWQTKTQM